VRSLYVFSHDSESRKGIASLSLRGLGCRSGSGGARTTPPRVRGNGWVEGSLLAFLFVGRHDEIDRVGLLSSVKVEMKLRKEGLWPITDVLGEKFGVVFSFAVVVTVMESG
jgi:hypothetical protein